ncbi:D-alanyl-D-alanine carboxypeptidase family protein [Paenibacillus thermoaerophilus]|uniref:D-alanyl-D-alanine carboxypeptidase family protein n=1 Tax=Paenibacillus thermoaerophilus TaxID=1215385 RepID=A0ABW2UWU4_9BACL|nr:M15 family metallopeptidase [Paenibacillus thermoaerophilus]
MNRHSQPRTGKKIRTAAAAIAVAAMLTAAACGSGSGTEPAGASPQATAASGGQTVTPKVPETLKLAPGAEQALEVQGVSDLSGVEFVSDRPELLTVDTKGVIRVSAKAQPGATAVIRTKIGGKELTTTVTIDGETATPSPSAGKTSPTPAASASAAKPQAKTVTVSNETDLLVVVNKQRRLPEGYVPPDLTEPQVPFSFTGKNERRYMRKEAAEALEKLFAAAKEDGIELVAVSGYRSQTTQKALFEGYVKTQGEKLARQYSAEPGHSEHQTGLAMDVSSKSAGFSLEEKFASTAEGKWLAEHAHEHGFIIRYPKGKESVTGYNYEPWHLRYVGVDIAREIQKAGLTLEEYFKDSIAADSKS